MRLSGIILEGSNLSRADLSLTDLTGADLGYADLSDTKLDGGDFTRADLSGVNLSARRFGDAQLNETDLTSSDLSYAWLNGANLKHTNLPDADLTGANLGRADLSGATLIGAKMNQKHRGVWDPEYAARFNLWLESLLVFAAAVTTILIWVLRDWTNYAQLTFATSALETAYVWHSYHHLERRWRVFPYEVSRFGPVLLFGLAPINAALLGFLGPFGTVTVGDFWANARGGRFD